MTEHSEGGEDAAGRGKGRAASLRSRLQSRRAGVTGPEPAPEWIHLAGARQYQAKAVLPRHALGLILWLGLDFRVRVAPPAFPSISLSHVEKKWMQPCVPGQAQPPTLLSSPTFRPPRTHRRPQTPDLSGGPSPPRHRLTWPGKMPMTFLGLQAQNKSVALLRKF